MQFNATEKRGKGRRTTALNNLEGPFSAPFWFGGPDEVSMNMITCYLNFGHFDHYYVAANKLVLNTLLRGQLYFNHGSAFDKDNNNGNNPEKTPKTGKEKKKNKDELELELIYDAFIRNIKVHIDCLGFVAICTRKTARMHEKLQQQTSAPPSRKRLREEEGDEEQDEEDEDEEEEEEEDSLVSDYYPVILDLRRIRTFIRRDNYCQNHYEYRAPADIPGVHEIILDGVYTLEHPVEKPLNATQFCSIAARLYPWFDREIKNFNSFDRYIKYVSNPLRFIKHIPEKLNAAEQVTQQYSLSGPYKQLTGLKQNLDIQVNHDTIKPGENPIMVPSLPGQVTDWETPNKLLFSSSTTDDNDPRIVLPSLPSLTNDVLASSHVLAPGYDLASDSHHQNNPPALILEYTAWRKEMTNRLLGVPDSIEKNFTLGGTGGKSGGGVGGPAKGKGSTVSTNNDGRKTFDENLQTLRKFLLNCCQLFIDTTTELERNVNAVMINDENKKAEKRIIYHTVDPYELRTEIHFTTYTDWMIMNTLYKESTITQEAYYKSTSDNFDIPEESFEKNPEISRRELGGIIDKPETASSSTSKPKKKKKTSS